MKAPEFRSEQSFSTLEGRKQNRIGISSHLAKCLERLSATLGSAENLLKPVTCHSAVPGCFQWAPILREINSRTAQEQSKSNQEVKVEKVAPGERQKWETPAMEDVSEQVMAQPYIRFT